MNRSLNDFERRLVEALQQEASHAMTMTDTPRELRRWRDRQRNRRTRQRVVASVAVAAAVGGVIVGATLVVGLRDTHVTPATNPSVVHLSMLGPLQVLPASTSVTPIKGPVNLSGSVAFGAVWATGAGVTSGHLYRLNPTTGAVLSDSTYPRPAESDGAEPFRVGNVMLVPSTPSKGARGYLVYSANGAPTGRLVAAPSPQPGAGDARGGWVQLTASAIGRLDANGRLQRTVAVTSGDQVTAIGLGPAGLWAGVVNGDLLHLDAVTGALISRVRLVRDAVPSIAEGSFATQVLSTSNGVYAATASYQIVGVDRGGRVTAVSTIDEANKSYPFITMGPDGNVWVEPNQGGIALLDPRTLGLVRGMQVFPNTRDGGVTGMTVTSHQIFVGDVDRAQSVTFATP